LATIILKVGLLVFLAYLLIEFANLIMTDNNVSIFVVLFRMFKNKKKGYDFYITEFDRELAMRGNVTAKAQSIFEQKYDYISYKENSVLVRDNLLLKYIDDEKGV
jgi:hypothetical protein